MKINNKLALMGIAAVAMMAFLSPVSSHNAFAFAGNGQSAHNQSNAGSTLGADGLIGGMLDVDDANAFGKQKCTMDCPSSTSCTVKDQNGNIYANCSGTDAKKDCQAKKKECNNKVP